jgi:hypothetical protein
MSCTPSILLGKDYPIVFRSGTTPRTITTLSCTVPLLDSLWQGLTQSSSVQGHPEEQIRPVLYSSSILSDKYLPRRLPFRDESKNKNDLSCTPRRFSLARIYPIVFHSNPDPKNKYDLSYTPPRFSLKRTYPILFRLETTP